MQYSCQDLCINSTLESSFSVCLDEGGTNLISKAEVDAYVSSHYTANTYGMKEKRGILLKSTETCIQCI